MEGKIGIEISQLERLLSEFPWLWAISTKWPYMSLRMRVSELTKDIINQDFEKDTEFWYYYKTRFGTHAVTHFKITISGKFPLGVLSNFCRGEIIEYIAAVQRDPSTTIEIFRPKKHSEIIELLIQLHGFKSQKMEI